MDIRALVERGVRRAEVLGATEAEVYAVREETLTVRGNVRGVESIEGGETVHIYMRIAVGKRFSVQGGLVSRAEDVDSIAESAVKIARLSPEDPNWVSLPKKLGSTPVFDVVDSAVKSLEPERFVDIVKRALEMPRELDRRAFATEASASAAVIAKAIGNSYQPPVSCELTSFSFSVDVKAVEEGFESGFYSYYSAPTLKEFRLENIVVYTTRIAVDTLKAKRVETGAYRVLLMPRVFSSILGTLLVPAVRADVVQKKRSPLAGKLFSQVLSEQLTVIDDGAVPNMPGSAPFDDEGVATRRKAVFDRGILRTYLYDTYTANIDNRESTGNARRVGASNTYPDATNILVLPGTSSLDSLVKDMGRGIVVHGTIGEWLSNPVSGYLNATVTHGFLVEGGEVKQAVKGVVIAGDAYKLLKEGLVALSKEFEAVGNFMTPAALLQGVSVAGE
jgi:PmbA protein